VTIETPPASARRFLFVDGLRGVAAMAVVVHHAARPISEISGDWVPARLLWIADLGTLGVDVFFVLSGFVIAHSIRNAEPSFRYLARFGLRRSIRLDPPLWATIAIELALVKVTMVAFTAQGAELPSFTVILSNVTYTQELLQLPNIVAAFWSLTYEVQFYIVLVGTFVVVHLLFPTARARIARVLLAGSLAYSLLIWTGVLPQLQPGLFIQRWFQFALGIWAWAAAQGHMSRRSFGVACMVSVCAILLISSSGPGEFGETALTPSGFRQLTIAVAVATAVALYLALVFGRMGDWLASRPIQFLGGISYSLYLLHSSVGDRFIALTGLVAPAPLGPASALVLLVASVALSVVCSWCLYRVVEKPSIALGRRVSLPRRRP
jgi:peptidoglycan/LPS O-acetylase OafA/YrhL